MKISDQIRQGSPTVRTAAPTLKDGEFKFSGECAIKDGAVHLTLTNFSGLGDLLEGFEGTASPNHEALSALALMIEGGKVLRAAPWAQKNFTLTIRGA